MLGISGSKFGGQPRLVYLPPLNKGDHPAPLHKDTRPRASDPNRFKRFQTKYGLLTSGVDKLAQAKISRNFP
jgi:hypothetical protein